MGGGDTTGIKLLVRLNMNKGCREKLGGKRAAAMATDIQDHTATSALETLPHWVQCDACMKWRKLAPGVNPKHLAKTWRCENNTWNTAQSSCLSPEECYTEQNIHEPPYRLLHKMEAGRFVCTPQAFL